MTNNLTITPSQMAMLMLAFNMGSSIVFIPGPVVAASGTSAWLSIIIAALIGLVMLAGVLYLHRCYPHMTLLEMYRELFGKPIAVVLAIGFSVVMLLMIANITLGLGSFFTATMMVETRPYVFQSLILVIAAITAYTGIVNTARLFIVFLFIANVMVLLTLTIDLTVYEPDSMLPQLNEGIRPILHGAYIAYGFPYSEMFVIGALLFFVRQGTKESLTRHMLVVWLYYAALLTTVAVMGTMVFGVTTGDRRFLLYEMARVIEFPGALERVEAIAGIVLISSSYVKATIALFAVTVGLSRFMGFKDEKALIFPVALICLFISMTMFTNVTEASHFWTGIWPAVTTTCGLPMLLAACWAWVKRRMGRGKSA